MSNNFNKTEQWTPTFFQIPEWRTPILHFRSQIYEKTEFTDAKELTDEDIDKYIKFFVNEEIRNGRSPDNLALKDVIEVWYSLYYIIYIGYII